MGSAFHQLCPRYRGTLTPTTITAIRLRDTFTYQKATCTISLCPKNVHNPPHTHTHTHTHTLLSRTFRACVRTFEKFQNYMATPLKGLNGLNSNNQPTSPSAKIHPLAYRQITTLKDVKDYYKFTFPPPPRIIIHWTLPAHIPVLPTLAQFSTVVCQVKHLKRQYLFLSFTSINPLQHLVYRNPSEVRICYRLREDR